MVSDLIRGRGREKREAKGREDGETVLSIFSSDAWRSSSIPPILIDGSVGSWPEALPMMC